MRLHSQLLHLLGFDCGGVAMTDHCSEQRSQTEQLKEVINQLRFELDLLKNVNSGLSSGRDKIITAAKELGYTFSTEFNELDYIIELARSTVIVNERNFELAKKLNEAVPSLDEEWRRRI